MNKNTIIKIPSMTIGAAGGILSLYSIIADGNMHAEAETKEDMGKHYLDMYIKAGSSSRESNLLERVKKFVIGKRLDDTNYPMYLRIKNHSTGWVGEVVEHIVPLTLSAIALTSPLLFNRREANINKKLTGINKFTKKIPLISRLPKLPNAQRLGALTSATAAGLLIFGAVKVFLNEVWGLGKNDL